MITEEQEEQAGLYATGALPDVEQRAFEGELRANPELRQLVLNLQRVTELIATIPLKKPPMDLRAKILAHVALSAVAQNTASPDLGVPAGLRFISSAGSRDWKKLPMPGAYIKLLSLERERGYAVLMGKLEPGACYPGHVNAGPEDFYILTGDLVIGDRKLIAGDFHHADGGSKHADNHSVQGCTLLAVLTTEDPLVAFAMA